MNCQIKRLKWEREPSLSLSRANGLRHYYAAEDCGFLSMRDPLFYREEKVHCGSSAAAMAMAQAHYEQQVLEHLEVTV